MMEFFFIYLLFGFRKGKKIARWFTSYLAKKSSSKDYNFTLNEKGDMPGEKMSDEEYLTRSENFVEQNEFLEPQSLPERSYLRKASKTKKSFSHELGPKGGIRPTPVRAHSYSDLRELLGSLHSELDAVKQAVDADLTAFAWDVTVALEKDSLSTARETAEDLLNISQQCREMTCSQFRDNCERIVQSLAERRHECQIGLVKQFVTRMLFILTRFARLLQFQKDSGSINDDSFDKFKQCLESVPAVETNWLPKSGNSACRLDNVVKLNHLSNHNTRIMKWENSSKNSLETQNESLIDSTDNCVTDSDSCDLSYERRKLMIFNHQEAFSNGHKNDYDLPEELASEASLDSLDEQGDSKGFDSVICRICEENVPTSHLESHSYICAYADKCDLEGLDVDERLINNAEILEQIVESYNQGSRVPYSSSDILKMQILSTAVGSEGHSPKVQEWHNKGTEGMFEDIHEMDTAFIDEFHTAKFGHCRPVSSNGSMTPTTTPTSSHFDLYWLEHNNPSEPEDVTQINELADIARRVAGVDIAKEGASKTLDMCLLDLMDILQNKKLKALVIDTFGGRIKLLLREKYLLAIEILKKKCPRRTIPLEDGRSLSESQCTTSAPLHPLHKERTSIDDFEIIKPISRGAFGRVFLARKRTTGDLFAIKVLKKLDMIRKNDIERILAERKILITVRNPFVVRFFYSFASRDNLYLVMEYLNGGDLYSLLRNVGCLDEEVARVYIAELVLGLEYLHSLGIIHRDLKPDNILIARNGHIKLTDFGLSKIGLINNAIHLSGSVTSGSVLQEAQSENALPRGQRSGRSAFGTPDYLAPEILLGNAHGYAADWWSVGIILFELIAGIPPFTANLPEMIFDNILNGKIPWPDVPNEMSFEAKDLIDRFLIQDPNLRLGASGAAEVKTHPFFKEINWDSLALQKAAFIPNPESEDDTSYFLSRYSPGSYQIPVETSTDCSTGATSPSSGSGNKMNVDKYTELVEFDLQTSVDLSSINFSFKNLSQLALMNYDVLLQGGKTSKCSSPSGG
ncbi:Non-specific serine/threonine protein kinase protein [Dioscorea alata]|uniref:Non-specific serine/threonine protein kinase protein n=2 Tax=Dioscorea alata TaxID=55571 RepID=A0ACB7VMI8_DIOAL|nr:Non-specific serine/threonine protein kinase protein [Dioscorea alata]KAH7675349.1 Non-specific serine/threonine protein kinase protein [Dioscorea alata]